MLPAKIGLMPSYRDMARKLRVSAGTVRNRIRMMYSSGLLTGSSVYANPNLLGLKGGAFAFDVAPSASKPIVIDRLKMIDGLLFIHNFLGSLVGILLLYKDQNELQRKLDQLLSLSGAKDGIFSSVTYPPCATIITDYEWRLISRLSQGGFQSYAQLAKDLEISVRTLKRRMAKIVRSHAVLSSPTLNYRAIVGGVPSDLIVMFTSPNAKADAEEKILQLVGDFLIFAGVGEGYMVYNLIVPGMQMASDLTTSVRRIHGVKTARAELVEEHIDLTRSLTTLRKTK